MTIPSISRSNTKKQNTSPSGLSLTTNLHRQQRRQSRSSFSSRHRCQCTRHRNYGNDAVLFLEAPTALRTPCINYDVFRFCTFQITQAVHLSWRRMTAHLIQHYNKYRHRATCSFLGGGGGFTVPWNDFTFTPQTITIQYSPLNSTQMHYNRISDVRRVKWLSNFKTFKIHD